MMFGKKVKDLESSLSRLAQTVVENEKWTNDQVRRLKREVFGEHFELPSLVNRHELKELRYEVARLTTLVHQLAEKQELEYRPQDPVMVNPWQKVKK